MDINKDQLLKILNGHDHLLSNLKPSEWAEKKRKMSSETTPFPGAFSFDRTPYLREPVDCLSPDHPSRIVAVQKGAQVGFSTGVIENGVGWIIEQEPGNILFLTGDKELSKEAVEGKLDQMIDSCGLRPLIRPNIIRKRNQRTGDTSSSKEFPGGRLIAGSTQNANKMRQRSMRYGFIDDFESAPHSDKKAGSLTKLIEQRFAAYYSKMKLFYISTPELKQTSNIEPVYLLGDQRKFHVPCPKCASFIVLEWSVDVGEKEKAGIFWKTDDSGRLIDGSVGYVCQNCGEFFTDKHKYEMNLAGYWEPTAKPSEIGYYSYHISSLYAPPGMYDWEHYARSWILANPKNQPAKVHELKTFVNVVLGQTWEDRGEAPKVNKLASNTRSYNVGIIPTKTSKKDGNGNILLITCACDLNGIVEDARLDYEITAFSENGCSYSVDHGSIGTFIPRENQKKNKVDRVKWSYEENHPRSVWPVFKEIISKQYISEEGKNMKIMITGVDTGHYTNYAYSFIDKNPGIVIGLKGDKVNKARRLLIDTPTFKRSKERSNLFLVEVNQIKDELAEFMKLNWNNEEDPSQPIGFMNFPQPSEGKYTMKSFFTHYESESRIIEKDNAGQGIAARWVKRNNNVMNHLWDCRVYNLSLKDIFVEKACRAFGLKIRQPSWNDYVSALTGKIK